MSADDTVMDRVARSLVSSHLQQKPTRCDLDYVMALAFATRRHGPAGEVVRYSLVGGSAEGVRRAAIAMTMKLNVRRKWGLEQKEVARVADAAVKMFLNPVCPACQGRRYQLQKNAPVLSARPCHKCNGTGKRNYPKHGEKFIRDVVGALTNIVNVTEQSVMWRLGIMR